MIRIPFSTGSEAHEVSSASFQESVVSDNTRDQLESRMKLLETKLGDHAEELKSNIVQRVDRIESRVSRALVTMGADSEDENAENVVEFQGEGDSHHLPATSAIGALNELNQTLELTRNHMEALNRSVTRMRETLAR